MTKFLAWTSMTTLLLGFSTGARAQQAPPADEVSGERTERILANLRFRIPPLREAHVEMGEIVATEIAGAEMGFFTVNGQDQYRYLVADGDATLYLLGADPIDISLSSEAIAEAMEEERLAAEQARHERHQALLAFTEGMPSRGNPDAPVTIVEFSDFQCSYCARGFETIKEVLARYPEDVRFVYLHFPLNNHPWAMPAAVAAVCAADQDSDAFWMLHDGYFRSQASINPTNLLERSRELLVVGGSGIDMEAWAACAANPQTPEYQTGTLSG